MRLAYLDGLRCLAVFAVLAQHYCEAVIPDQSRVFLSLGPGVFGVALFFMISGYVMPLSVKPGQDWRGFVWRRIFRILPMYWVILMMVVGLGAAGVPQYAQILNSTDASQMIANAFLYFEYVKAQAMLGVAWSLSLEITWYGLFFAIFAIWGIRQSANAGLIFCGALLALCLVSVIMDQRLPMGRLVMLNAALLGCARYGLDAGQISNRAFLRLNIAFAASAICALWVGFGYFEHPHVRLGSSLVPWILAYALFSITSGARRIQNTRLIQWSPLHRLGLWSYSIYLLHEPIRHAFDGLLSGLPLLAVATLATIAFAAYSFRVIETPANRFGKTLALSHTGAHGLGIKSRNPTRPKS